MDNGAKRIRAASVDVEPDTKLMVGITAQNADALEALFHRYFRLVYRVASDILHDSGEAEDVTQEVFLEVYRKAHMYDPARGSVRVWLLQYAYHRTLRRKAALGRRAAYRGEPLDMADGLVDDDRRRLTRDESRWVIRAGLAQLPARQRLTLELACFEELSLRDVAARLGVSIGSTRHYYYRGLARLQAWARAEARSADERTGARCYLRALGPRTP
jgi:RNA polymerase sigma-70 factor, ECF subfamily